MTTDEFAAMCEGRESLVALNIRNGLVTPLVQWTMSGNWTPPNCLICGGKRCAYCQGSARV